MNIPGLFNVSNALAAVAVARELSVDKAAIERGLASLAFVEGRMNRVDEGQPFGVIVDFASTPDGFEKFFGTMRPLVKGRLIAVFGSAGRRDPAKRGAQGKIAARYADELIITEEDDRDEDGKKIIEQIAKGAQSTKRLSDDHIHRIANREEAIGYAMTLATSPRDVVVLLGKGHEKTIERADGVYPWSDTEAARAALRALSPRR